MAQVLGALMLAASWCGEFTTTGYSRFEHGTHTYDGTPILTGEPIAAASWDIPINATVCVDDLGCYRVADRGGGLGSWRWLDIAVWDRASAFAITGRRHACVSLPGIP